MNTWPPPHVRLQAVSRPLASGKTVPLLVRCGADDGDEGIDCVLKLRDKMENGSQSMAFEYIGAGIGHMLNVSMPQAVTVEVDQETALGIAELDPTVGARLLASLGVNFGTVYLPDATTILKPAEHIVAAEVERAFRILSFDALVDNADRGAGKVNLLVHGGRYFAIDHELCFSFVYDLSFVPSTVEDRVARALRRHPLLDGLRGKLLSYDDFEADIAVLTHDALDELCGECFPLSEESRAKVCDKVSAIREAPEVFMRTLREALR